MTGHFSFRNSNSIGRYEQFRTVYSYIFRSREEMYHITDLHIHLGGSWPLSYLKSVASPDEMEELDAFLDEIDNATTTYSSCFIAFALASKIINSNQRVEEGVAVLCKDLVAQKVTYVELRTGLKQYGSDTYEDYLQAILRGIERSNCPNLTIKLLLSLKRTSTPEFAAETLRLLLKYRHVVVGIDISDHSVLGDGTGIDSIIDDLHRERIPIALHLGECIEETEAQQIKELTRYQPARIGHGVFLSAAAKEYIYSRRLPIEMCISSSVKARMIKTANQHPGLELLLNSYPVAICTDDPLVFRIDHISENKRVQELLGYSDAQMEEVHRKALDYAFV